jgi:N-acetylneuraminic acid mutarotase
VYAISGRTAQAGNLGAAERLVRGRWERLPAVRHPRGGIAATAAGSEIVLLGGEEAAGTIRSVEAYTPAKRRWRFLAAMPTARHGLGAVTFRGRVFTFSGGPEPGLTYSARTEALRVSR